jgi:hypothetical protein
MRRSAAGCKASLWLAGFLARADFLGTQGIRKPSRCHGKKWAGRDSPITGSHGIGFASRAQIGEKPKEASAGANRTRSKTNSD